MRTPRPKRIAAAVAFALAAGGASAQYSNLYFLGDSSTDAGYFGARFTVNPGLVWAQVLGAGYGLAITPSNQGGTDFAAGGARVSQTPGFPPIPPVASAPPLTVQINSLLGSSTTLDPNALYSVSIGYNDIFTALAGAQAGLLTPAQMQAAVAQAATEAAAQVLRLRWAGARYIVALNVYDLGKSPAGLVSPTVPYTALSGLYNSTFQGALAQNGTQVMVFDTFKFFNEIVANPGTYGLTNVTQPACTVPTALLCTTSTLVAPNAGQNFAFADAVHPTPAGHALLAQAVNSMLQGPAQIATLGVAPLANESANFRTIDARFQAAALAPAAPTKLVAWATYDYANPDLKGNYTSGDAKLNTLTIGGDVKVTDKLIVGGALGFTQNKGDFGGHGGYTLDETTGTVYAGYGAGPFWLAATLGGGSLDYDDIERTFSLGPGTRTEQGDTNGSHFIGRILGGYWFQVDKLVHGPFAKYTYQHIKVDAYSEQGSSSTGLQYSDQNVYSNRYSLGWQATGQYGTFRPFGRVTWEYDSSANPRTITATPIGAQSSYIVPGFQPDDNWILFNFGASSDFGKVTGYLYGSASASKSDGNYWAVTLGISAPL